MHIEVVPKLNTDSCLNAIIRIIARRGKSNTIINGTNFVGAELESVRKLRQVKPHDSIGLISSSVIVSTFVNVLKEYKQIGVLQSSSTLYLALGKPPQVLIEKLWFYVDDKDEDRPDPIMFDKWLSRIAFVHEGFSYFKGERREEDRRRTNRDKRFSKTSNFSASSNVKETKQTQSDHCLLVDDTHKIWNCPLFKNVRVNDRYSEVRKQRLCYGCLGKGHAIKYCKYHACDISGCITKHNRLLQSENQMDEGNHAVHVSAATINQSNEVTSFRQIVPLSILEKKFGRPHVIIDAQLKSLRKASQVKPHHSTGLLSFSVTISNFVNRIL